MNILEVHEVNYFKKPIFEFIEIPEALSLRGHKVTVVDYGEGEDKRFSFKTKHFRGNRVFPASKVDVVRPGAILLGSLIGRFTNMISSWFVLRRLFRENKFDAVLLYSVPTNGWITLHFAKKHDVPVFFRTLDVLYELRPFPFPIKWIVRALEKQVYKNSDYLLALTPRLAAYCGRKDYLPLFPAVNDKIFYPFPAGDVRLTKLRKKHSIKSDDVLILYLGTFYDFGGLENFISSLKRIKQKIPNARLLFVGGGFVEPQLKELAVKEGVADDVIFTGFVPYDSVRDYINLADVCVNPFKECEATRHIIPTKLFQYMACRKTVISRRLPGILEIIPQKGAGVVYAVSDKELIDKTIAVLSDDALNARLAGEAFDFTKKKHSWPVFMDLLESYLKRFSKTR